MRNGNRIMQTIPKILKPVAGVAAGFAILAMAGCISTPDRSAGRVLDDKMIASKVKGALNDAKIFKFDDVKVGDSIEAYRIEQVQRTL